MGALKLKKTRFIIKHILYHSQNDIKSAVAVLRVPKTALVIQSQDKVRVSSAVVEKIFCRFWGRELKEGFSDFDPSFYYRLGATVKPQHKFDKNPHEGCGSGIHGCLIDGRKQDWYRWLETKTASYLAPHSKLNPKSGLAKAKAYAKHRNKQSRKGR